MRWYDVINAVNTSKRLRSIDDGDMEEADSIADPSSSFPTASAALAAARAGVNRAPPVAAAKLPRLDSGGRGEAAAQGGAQEGGEDESSPLPPPQRGDCFIFVRPSGPPMQLLMTRLLYVRLIDPFEQCV